MAKERNPRKPAAGAAQPKKPGRRAGSAPSSGGPAKAASGGKAAAHKSGGRKPADDRERRVRDRAYEIWEQEGRPAGREREHWERADRET